MGVAFFTDTVTYMYICECLRIDSVSAVRYVTLGELVKAKIINHVNYHVDFTPDPHFCYMFDTNLGGGGETSIRQKFPCWCFLQMELQNIYQHAAGFVFKTQFFYLTWGKSNNESDLILGQFVNRTSALPKVDNPKQLLMPANVGQGGVRTHVFVPDKNFTR